MLIEGLFIPVPTPFDRDGAVYVAKLAANVRRYSLAPVAGLIALGDVGEGAALTDAEVGEVLTTVGASAAADKVLLADCSAGSVAATLARIAVAAEAMFDAVIVGASAGWNEAERGMFFRMVADASPLPVVLRSDVAMPLDVSMIGELARHGNVVGLLEAELGVSRLQTLREATTEARTSVSVTTVFAAVTRRMQAAANAATLLTPDALTGGKSVAGFGGAVLKTRVKEVGFAILGGGRAAAMLEVLEAGAAGVVPELAACAPEACFEVYAAHKDGDPALAAVKQQRVLEADAMLGQLGVAGVKYACDRNGYYGGAPRLPRLPLLAAEREQADRAFAGIPS